MWDRIQNCLILRLKEAVKVLQRTPQMSQTGPELIQRKFCPLISTGNGSKCSIYTVCTYPTFNQNLFPKQFIIKNHIPVWLWYMKFVDFYRERESPGSSFHRIGLKEQCMDLRPTTLFFWGLYSVLVHAHTYIKILIFLYCQIRISSEVVNSGYPSPHIACHCLPSTHYGLKVQWSASYSNDLEIDHPSPYFTILSHSFCKLRSAQLLILFTGAAWNWKSQTSGFKKIMWEAQHGAFFPQCTMAEIGVQVQGCHLCRLG